MNDALKQNEDGSWWVACPMPMQVRKHLLFIRYECWHKNEAKTARCGKQFKSPREYESHYLDAHTQPLTKEKRIK